MQRDQCITISLAKGYVEISCERNLTYMRIVGLNMCTLARWSTMLLSEGYPEGDIFVKEE
jgi:hypothetical protein